VYVLRAADLSARAMPIVPFRSPVADVIDALEEARRGIELSVSDLSREYFAIGGMSTELEVEAPPVTDEHCS
jgi:hypothetical protein